MLRRLVSKQRFFLTRNSCRYHSSGSLEARQHLIGNNLVFWPEYFSSTEQRILLSASLHKLDSTESRQARKKRKDYWRNHPISIEAGGGGHGHASSLFAPDSLYEFQEGHYDGVIHHFREMHLSNWPTDAFKGLDVILDRLYSLCPTKDVQTHVLHLASYGNILPHVDNVGASGSWILGVSLGGERILRLKRKNEEKEETSIVLPSGSVYLQRDDVRYKYLHSIERMSADNAEQRLSIMIRDQNRENFALAEQED
ncbi:hypothetical protein CPC08DRAFT_703119 [Agrocybe pediades]|nr:hypothetical protein CPC08DRAFT_703119 [Agrocybe pediades]